MVKERKSSRGIEPSTDRDYMKIAACVVTRDRPEMLERCLFAIEASTRRPDLVCVSDDSSTDDLTAATRSTVLRHAAVAYLSGPRRGVCANRNNCLATAASSDVIVFLDDDTLVDCGFFAAVELSYGRMTNDRAAKTILVGVRCDEQGRCESPSRINFLGHFEAAAEPEMAGASYSAYPAAFFSEERWDENIYFGYEDAELSMRALERGYRFQLCLNLKALNLGAGQSSFGSPVIDRVCVHAARLYVGTKRYLYIRRSLPRFILFAVAFAVHLTAHLIRTRSIDKLPLVVRLANLQALLRDYGWRKSRLVRMIAKSSWW
jgi:GT2 family glycosyltransferase